MPAIEPTPSLAPHPDNAMDPGKQAERDRQKVYRRAAELRKAIRTSFENGQNRKAKKAIRNYLNSPDAKTASVLHVKNKLDLDTARRIAKGVDPFRKDWPAIKWYPHPKTSGGFRPVCKFSIAHQATLKMIAAVLAAQWNRPHNLYGTASSDRNDTNTGRDAAARHVHKHLKDGFTYVATADIKNAFGSIDPDAINTLPLQDSIIAKALDLRNQRFIEVTPPDRVSKQKPRVEVDDLGEAHVWMEYTMGLDKSSGLDGNPISEWVCRTTPEAQVCQQNLPIPDRHWEQGLRPPLGALYHNHAQTGREDAETRSQEQGLRRSPGTGSINTPIDDTVPEHSELVPHGLAQGGSSSPIIFAMLIGELPNVEDDTRFLVCHDNVIVLAKTPDARRRSLETLTDHFAHLSRAGSLTLELEIETDGGPFEWLGYRFDPSGVNDVTKGIGVGEISYERLLGGLNRAQAEDLKDLEKYGCNRASDQPCGYPLRVWHTLRNWRGGVGAVHPQHEDLMSLVDFDGSGWLADRYAATLRNPEVLTLHQAIFTTVENPNGVAQEDRDRLNEILREFGIRNRD